MREVIDFDENWLFHRGDVTYAEDFPAYKGVAYMGAKTERKKYGPASRFYNDDPDCYSEKVEYKSEKWERVTLPHDYVIEGEPDKRYNCSLGFFKYENAWYRKHFTVLPEDRGKRITLLFEGVATHATVYLNGCLIKHNFCGYTTFEVDISEYVLFGEDNVLAVYVETSDHEGWWYEGAGIYRHVKMIKTEPVCVDLWGIFAKPVYSDGKWTVITETTVRNDCYSSKSVSILGEITDENGEIIAVAKASGKIAPREKRAFTYVFNVENPRLWSPESPVRYVMRASVYCGEQLKDVDDVKFGFRYFYADPDKGLLINGKHYLIKGVCSHADCGLLGKAVPDNVHRYKIKLIKEMGANGYRTSHYPHAEAVMEALDENGFIVMDETRWFESTDEGKEQLEMLIKRDRNRPCVFFWSVGNEERYFTTDAGKRIFKSLASVVKKLDDSRPITVACDRPVGSEIFDDADLIGINYNWNDIDEVRKKYPKKAMFSSECCASGTTRGWYFDADPEKAFLPAVDNDTGDFFTNRERTWKFITNRPWMMGGYQWIAFEHRGEAVWPRLCSISGAIDLFLQKKDAFYQNRSHWIDEPVIHLMPHWNFRGMEGKPITVTAYTNCEEAELFVNGVSAGRQPVEKYTKVQWNTEYRPGSIEVIGYNGGKAEVSEKRETTGKAVALALTLDTEDVKANGKDVAIFSCYCVDEQGREVPDAQPVVTFTASGAGVVYSTGSDITDHTTLLCGRRRMRAGRISVAVKMTKKSGELTLIATADGLDGAYFSKNIEE